MRLRTFTAPDMPAAMKLVREALGDDAIILTTESKGVRGIRITAAVEEDRDERPVDKEQKNDPLATDHLRFEIQSILRFHNLPELFAAKLMQKAADGDLGAIMALHALSPGHDERHVLRLTLDKLVSSYFRFDPLPLESHSLRIMLVGPPGAGKTLTIARLAAQIVMQKHKLAVITTDNKRAGGIEQLQAFTDILGLELNVATKRAELRKLLEAMPTRTRVLIDTAGCNPYEEAELAEVKTYAAHESVEPVLVLPAGGDSLETIDIAEAFMQLPIRRLLVTRADTARRFGGVLAAAAAHKLAFCNASSSSSIAEAPAPMDSALLAQFMLRYKY